ncbi:hypothetical protein CUMW_015390 [Citrus unshiu]|nr:hypothetical protein CUMW_015390 [Citrus unshiu]
MKASSSEHYKKQKLQQRGCKALCCSCRLSVSSSEEAESSNSDQFASVSSLAHAMVQERLDQMIRERQEARHRERRKQRLGDHDHQGTKFIIMVAMEKCSYDPREDFRESMIEMIMANRIEETKDLRSLLNYYLSMNSEEYHGIILEWMQVEFKLEIFSYYNIIQISPQSSLVGLEPEDVMNNSTKELVL